MLAIGDSCTVFLNQHPTGRRKVQGIVAKVNHATILVKFSDGQYVNRKIKRDLAAWQWRTSTEEE